MTRDDEIEMIWRHYLQYHPRLPMSPPRAEAKRLGLMLDDGYDVELLCDAIDGLAVDPWFKSKGIHRLRCIYHLQAGDDVDRVEQFAQVWEVHQAKQAAGEARRRQNERNQEYARRERLEAIAEAKRKAANEAPAEKS